MSQAKSAAEAAPAKPHRSWDKLVAAAYLRLMGATQKQAAASVGRAERTIQEWEAHDAWPAAQEEARQRWLVDLEDGSRRAVLQSVLAGNADLGFKVLERRVPELAPPKVRSEVTGADGEPLTINVVEVRSKVKRRLAAVGNRIAGHLAGEAASGNGDGAGHQGGGGPPKPGANGAQGNGKKSGGE